MASATFSSPSDLLGLASSVIVIEDSGGGQEWRPVETFDSSGAIIGGSVTRIRPIYVYNVRYRLEATATLTFTLGAVTNTDYVIIGYNYTSSQTTYPTITLNFVKFSNINKRNSASKTKEYTFAGGFGVVATHGATVATGYQGVSSTSSATSQSAEVLEATSGDFHEGGYAVYGIKASHTLDATGAITVSSGTITGDTVRESVTGHKLFTKAWSVYP